MALTESKDMMAAIAVTRFGLGARPGELDEARGDPRGWLKAQIRRQGADQPVPTPLTAPPAAPPLTPAPAPATAGTTVAVASTPLATISPPVFIPPTLAEYARGETLPTMQQGFRAWAAFRDTVKGAKADLDLRRQASVPLYQGLGREVLVRQRLATMTPAPFRERWALFWANHFTVAAVKGQNVAVAVGPFEREAIRPYVFGRFEDMLLASSSHPGMLMYLDQVESIGPNSPAALKRPKAGLNENLGREILELHTVGPDAGYTQADVTEFARALTGWSMGGPNAPYDQQGRFLYRAEFHEPGARTIMGRKFPDDGPRQALAVLVDLANDPRTAEHLSRKIAAHFVADDPPPVLVARLKDRFLHTRGDLGEVARALVDSPEAWTPAALKLKTPNELLISGYRAAAAVPLDPAKEIVGPLSSFGQRPFSAPQPNGWSDSAATWAAPDAMVKRLTWAAAFAGYYAPKELQPQQVADAALGARLTPATLTAVGRAETRPEAFTILLMSPEFQRR